MVFTETLTVGMEEVRVNVGVGVRDGVGVKDGMGVNDAVKVNSGVSVGMAVWVSARELARAVCAAEVEATSRATCV